MKYKTKSITIDAMPASEIIADWAKPSHLPLWARRQVEHRQIHLAAGGLLICTPLGPRHVAPADYVVCHSDGEIHTMTAAAFATAYEVAP